MQIIILEGKMNPELLGMSNEELIQWACKHALINYRAMKNIIEHVEPFCALHPVSIGLFVEQFVALLSTGVGRLKAFEAVQGLYECE